jgi:Zn-dependent protease with chaperone function
MATDFFERQSTARRNTKWLIWAFSLSVLGILATTFIVTTVAVGASENVHNAVGPGRGFPWQIPGAATVGALGLIAGGSLFKIAQLAGGGSGVAERLGGRRLYPNSLEPNERRLLNVVEEMALASGVPVPPVFLLKDEEGINAFAAGFSPSDAVIGVTRGCVDQLSRDQLQGVIAHEFSHILNGDMRLNLRMIGILNGILLLGLVGRELLRFASYGGRSSRRNDPTVYLLLIGVAMMVLGFLGTLLGNLIKAAISRQREFLADASAVQFTRNPEGIAGALKRIGAALFGSRLTNPRAAEASHMYFAEGVSGLFATHPPLTERIRRLDPQWDGRFPEPLTTAATAALAGGDAAEFVGGAASLFRASVPVEVVRHAAEQVGNPTEVHRRYAAELVAAMPAAVVEAAHDPYGARAVIYASLLDVNQSIRAVQLDALRRLAEPDVYKLTIELLPAVDQLDVRAYLPLVDMALPALRALSPSQYRSFSKCFVKLVQADNRLGLFEWTLHQILLRHLRPQFEQVRSPQIVYYGLQKLGGPCSVLLSTLARSSQCDDKFAFESGARRLPDVPLRLLPAEQCGLSDLQTALEQLTRVVAKQQQRLIDAAAATICADSEVRVEEAELLRGICDMLNCPMPPLLPGERVAVTQAVP